MCTRIVFEVEAARAGFSRLGLSALAEVAARARDRFNLGPGAELTAMRAGSAPGTARAFAPRWGWSGGARGPLLNARAESLAERPAFAEARLHRRCLVLATGFYEWEKRGAARLPWLFRRADGAPFALAGLWDEQGERPAAVVVTTAADAVVGRIHDRRPVWLPDAEACRAWLDARTAASAVDGLLAAPASHLVATPVSPRLNRGDWDAPGCVAPASHGVVGRAAGTAGELPLG